MRYLQRFHLKRLVKKAIEQTREGDLQQALAATILVFRKLEEKQLLTVWRHPHCECYLYGKSLNAMLGSKTPDRLVPSMVNPLVWLTGIPSVKMISVLTNPCDECIRDILQSVWYMNVKYPTAQLTENHNSSALRALQVVLKGLEECLF